MQTVVQSRYYLWLHNSHPPVPRPTGLSPSCAAANSLHQKRSSLYSPENISVYIPIYFSALQTENVDLSSEAFTKVNLVVIADKNYIADEGAVLRKAFRQFYNFKFEIND